MAKIVVEVRHKVALSVPEAAALLGMSDPMVRERVADGRLARVANTGARVLIARTEVDRFANVKATPTRLAVAS